MARSMSCGRGNGPYAMCAVKLHIMMGGACLRCCPVEWHPHDEIPQHATASTGAHANRSLLESKLALGHNTKFYTSNYVPKVVCSRMSARKHAGKRPERRCSRRIEPEGICQANRSPGQLMLSHCG